MSWSSNLVARLAPAGVVLLFSLTGSAAPGEEAAGSPLPTLAVFSPAALPAGRRAVVEIPPGAALCLEGSANAEDRTWRIAALDLSVRPGSCTPPLWAGSPVAERTVLALESTGLPNRSYMVYLVVGVREPAYPREYAQGQVDTEPGVPGPAAAGEGELLPEGAAPTEHVTALGRNLLQAAPVERLEASPNWPQQQALVVRASQQLLYRWPATGAESLGGWAYGVLPRWVAAGLVDLRRVDPTLRIDLRYAGTDNFLGEQLYPVAVPLLRSEVARAVATTNQFLRARGLGLLVWDAYRPFPVQQRMWERVPDRRYVADPARGGSNHNRGVAVDVTLVAVDGTPVSMPTDFDAFTPQAAHGVHGDLSNDEIFNREVLRLAMELHGFRALRTEWWHYTYPLDSAAVLDVELE